jgi:hypothetical protein
MTVLIAFSPAAFIVSPDSTPPNVNEGAWAKWAVVRTNEINNSIRNTQSTSRLNTPPNVLNLRLPAHNPRLFLQHLEKLLSQRSKTRNNPLPNQFPRIPNPPCLRNLNLQSTLSKTQLENLVNFPMVFFMCFEFGDLVLSCNAQMHISFSDEPGDICSGEEYESQRVVFDESNVKAIVAVELDV